MSCPKTPKNKVVGCLTKKKPESYADAGQLKVNVIRYGQCKNVNPTQRDLVKRTKRLVNYGEQRKVNKLADDDEITCPPSEIPVKVVKPLICPCPKDGCCGDQADAE